MGAALGSVRSETPAHVVLRRSAGYEVWRYPASVAAVVHASSLPPGATDRNFRNAAFGALARYIGVFSSPDNFARCPEGNTAPEKIAMTAPVVMTPPAEKVAMTAPVVMTGANARRGESMRFLLPAKYRSVADAPVPTNPVVKLQLEAEGRVEAVLTFSGELDMTVAAARAEELRAMLKKDGIEPVGEWKSCAYNPPFTLPMLRRNEVHFPLDPATFTEEHKH